MDIGAILQDVPDYDAFLTVDELDESSRRLAEEHPESVELFVAGQSREGRPILCLKVGDGAKSALVFGCVHPNEPIGSMMLEYLSRRLSEDHALRDELGYTWYLIKCIDPDGTRLNEGWFKGPFTPTHYMRNFFRPASPQQVEWTFPIHYKGLHFDDALPETRALMTLIERIRPDFMYSLHNGGFGGVYYYISDPATDLYEPFHQLAHDQGLPLSLGEPEVPYGVAFHPAIYAMLGAQAAYDYLEKFTAIDPATAITHGTSSGEYARRFKDTFTLVCELPYFYDPRIDDGSNAGMSRRDAVLRGIESEVAFYARLNAIYLPVKGLLTLDSPYRRTVDDFIASGVQGIEAKRAWAMASEELGKEATVAEAFDNLVVSRFYHGLLIGVLARMLAKELGDGLSPGRRALEEAFAQAVAYREEWLEALEADLHYEVVPIKKLASIQLGAGLHAAMHAKGGA
jgi:hypothetical protein